VGVPPETETLIFATIWKVLVNRSAVQRVAKISPRWYVAECERLGKGKLEGGLKEILARPLVWKVAIM
jgi:hypothetical protein